MKFINSLSGDLIPVELLAPTIRRPQVAHLNDYEYSVSLATPNEVTLVILHFFSML